MVVALEKVVVDDETLAAPTLLLAAAANVKPAACLEAGTLRLDLPRL